jgi:hypothetical protein
MALRGGLCSGDVFVPGSRRYVDPASFLLAPEVGASQWWGFCQWSSVVMAVFPMASVVTWPLVPRLSAAVSGTLASISVVSTGRITGT